MATWPTSVPTDANLYLAVNELQTNLSSGITNSQTTITLNSTTSFPTVGLVLIDNEIIKYTGVSGSDLTGCTRAFDSSTAATHSGGAVVSFAICAAHHNVSKDEIIALCTYLSNNLGTGAQPLSNGTRALASNGSGKIIESSVTSTELGYLSGVTSAIQTQLGLKAPLASPTFTGTIGTPLTASKVVQTDGSGNLTTGTETGTGNTVRATSPTLTTPILGTPTSGALTNCTSIPVAQATGALPVANGGTGATATTGSGNNVLSTSPTMVTPVLGAASATSINFGDTSLAKYKEGTWTPSDQSGASLTFTVTTAKYTKIGKVVYIELFLTFPSTASGAANQIGGLPFSVDDEAVAVMRSNAALTNDVIRFIAGTSNFQIMTSNGGTVATNVGLTTAQIIMTGFYFHSD